MDMKSMVPSGRGRTGRSRPEASGFDALQKDVDRLFDEFNNNFGRGFSALVPDQSVPRINVAETDKEIEVTAELPACSRMISMYRLRAMY